MGNRTVKAYKSDGMSRYLKRFWKENTLTILVLAALCGIQVGANILMMWSFQGIIDRDMNRFLFWMLLLVAVWFLLHGLSGLETLFSEAPPAYGTDCHRPGGQGDGGNRGHGAGNRRKEDRHGARGLLLWGEDSSAKFQRLF